MKAKSINPDNLISVRDYALLVGKTTQNIYQLIAADKVKTIKIAGKLFIIKAK